MLHNFCYDFSGAQAAVTSTNSWDICTLDVSHGPSQWKCVNCGDYLCDQCATHHRKGNKLRYHRLMHARDQHREEEIRKEIFCSKHNNEELQMFCRDDKKAICSICSLTTHKGHSISKIEEYADTERSRIGSALSQADGNVGKYEIALANMKSILSEAERTTSDNCKEIDLTVKEVIRKINMKASDMKEDEKRNLRKFQNNLGLEKDKLEQRLRHLKEKVIEVRSFLEECTPNELTGKADYYVKQLPVEKPTIQEPTMKISKVVTENVRREISKFD